MSTRNKTITLSFSALLSMSLLFMDTNAMAASSDSQTLTTSVKQALQEATPALKSYYEAHNPSTIIGWPMVAMASAETSFPAADVTSALQTKQISVKARGVGRAATDYASLLLGILAAGGNPRNIGHVDLITCIQASERLDGKFGDTIDGVGESLVNSDLWSVIALYAAGQPIPASSDALAWLTAHQHTDGSFGWSTADDVPDVDMTAMALLAYHALGQDGTNAAVQKAFSFLQRAEQPDGGFGENGQESAESTAAVLEALVAYGMDPMSSPWQHNASNPVVALLSMQTSDGTFRHIASGNGNIMATVQAVTALGDVASGVLIYDRLASQSRVVRDNWQPAFVDLVTSDPMYPAMATLVGMGVLAGMSDTTMAPDGTVTREQFAKMLVYAMGDQSLPVHEVLPFKDVSTSDWAYPDILIAWEKGWVSGRDSTHFGPKDGLMGAELMTLLVRAMGQTTQVSRTLSGTWYGGYVSLAAAEGLLYPGFVPTAQTSRGDCAESLLKLLRAQGT